MTILPYVHPCLKCGACCAFFRVSFHWSETLAESHGVPLSMTKSISPYMNAMKGTDQKSPNCIAFKGTVGKSGNCKIYEHRPNCCRLFKASFEDGTRSSSCEEARAGKGLDLLTAADWNMNGAT
jgi:uncharacterized protein